MKRSESLRKVTCYLVSFYNFEGYNHRIQPLQSLSFTASMPVTLGFPAPVTEQKIAKIIKELQDNNVHLREDSHNENTVIFSFVERTPDDRERMADLFKSWLRLSEPMIETYQVVEE